MPAFTTHCVALRLPQAVPLASVPATATATATGQRGGGRRHAVGFSEHPPPACAASVTLAAGVPVEEWHCQRHRLPAVPAVQQREWHTRGARVSHCQWPPRWHATRPTSAGKLEATMMVLWPPVSTNKLLFGGASGPLSGGKRPSADCRQCHKGYWWHPPARAHVDDQDGWHLTRVARGAHTAR